jgi:hypothetical protein
MRRRLKPKKRHAANRIKKGAHMPRQPTDQEWNQLHTYFPNLDRDSVTIMDEPTGVYNCIAWALGYDDRWINPPNNIADFNALFLGDHPAGYTEILSAASDDAIGDGWGIDTNDMQHGSRIVDGNWESKLGPSYRITHNRDGVRGDIYGDILVSYR